MITWWMKLGGNLPLGHGALLFSISATGSFNNMPSHTDTAGHTKAFASHTDTAGHTKAFASHTDTAGHTNLRTLFTQSWATGGKVKVLRHKADCNSRDDDR